MKYTAKGLETEPYKAYSRDAFNDEEKGVAYFAHGYRCAGKTGEVDNILRALIDTTRYIETSLPGVDKIIITADDGSDKEIKMFPIDWFWIVDFDLINWYGMGNERSSGENRAPVSEEFYDMWENYRSRASSHKKKHPKPSAKDGIQIENCGADYFFKTNFVAARAHAEMVYKKYTHVHSEPKLEWLAVPEDRPISDLELRDYMFYERESALNLAIEISAALADFLKLDKKHGNGNMVFYNITLFELKQRLLPDLLKTNAIYFRIAIARTFIYALLNLFTDQMNSGWEDADTQTQYKKSKHGLHNSPYFYVISYESHRGRSQTSTFQLFFRCVTQSGSLIRTHFPPLIKCIRKYARTKNLSRLPQLASQFSAIQSIPMWLFTLKEFVLTVGIF